MTFSLGDQMGGMMLIEITGGHPEQLMNLLMSRGVYIQNVERNGDTIVLKIRTSALKSVQAVAEEQGLTLRVLRRAGVPEVRRRIRRRRGLLLGTLAVVLLLYIGNSFIWFINAGGSRIFTPEEILAAARECGFYVGAFRPEINRLEVEESLLRRLPELVYAEIRINGVKADIMVVDRVMLEEDIREPCDIVARTDGVVEEVLLQEGRLLVQKGDAVVRGQRLIAGEYRPEASAEAGEETEEPANSPETAEQPVRVRARGIIRARVWYEGYGECPLLEEIRQENGEKAHMVELCYPGGSWVLGEQPEMTGGRKEVEAHLWNTPLGEIGWKTTIFAGESVSRVEHTPEEAFALAREAARNMLWQRCGEKEMPGEMTCQVISQPSDTVVRVEARLETVENIAVPRLLRQEKTGTEKDGQR